MKIPVPRNFDFGRAVCSYGFFMLAPTRWNPKTQTLHRPLHGEDGRIFQTRTTHPAGRDYIDVAVDPAPSAADRALLRAQIARMLRLDEDPANFERWAELHPKAAAIGFGRLFRSPTIFEDIVKTMTACNVTWTSTMRMNRLLVEHVGGGAFPTPVQVAATRIDALKRRCKVGYRSKRIVLLAREVVAGRLDLARFENSALTTDALIKQLCEIHGVGPFAAANLCQLLGRYDRVAIDSETYRHFREELGIPTPEVPTKLHPQIDAHFARWAPFQFLAYWFDLWQSSERRVGDARQWDTEAHNGNFLVAKPEPGKSVPGKPAPKPSAKKRRRAD
ncbi:MAG: hypothetical protein NTW19_19895 [Planctomycetota bacterium]|nr:hypothetical protein [Planctomycetota bacterium]